MSYLTAPSTRMTSSFNDHKSRGTTGEDWGEADGATEYNDQFKYPTTHWKSKVGTYQANDGTYCEYWNFTAANGFKFSARTCHCKDFRSVGDDYTGSTGYHLHAQFCVGHKTEAWIQENRNSSAFIPFAELDKQAAAYSKQYYVNLSEDCDDNGVVGVYSDSGCTVKLGNIKPCNYGGLTYTNIDNKTGKSSSGYTTCKIKTESLGYGYVTVGYPGRTRDTSKKY